VRGLQDNGMLATLKHFPGHGDTDADSHLGLPTIRADYARLDSVELVPFRAGIDAGAQVVMSAHIAFPAFTGDAPATLSAAMLTGVLRDSLKFKGLVVTDALQMGAIVAKYGAGDGGGARVRGGLRSAADAADPDSAIASMLVALQSGRITAARLDRLRATHARHQAGGGAVPAAHRAARFHRPDRRLESLSGCRRRPSRSARSRSCATRRALSRASARPAAAWRSLPTATS